MSDAKLDLTLQSVRVHFAETTRNVRLLNFLLALDRVDKWAIDYNEFESSRAIQIRLFIQDLQLFVEANLPVLHRVAREFVEILSVLTTTRCMYLISFVSQYNEEFIKSLGQILEDETGESPNIAAVKRRIEAFNQAQLLGEIFSGKRLRRIMQIMGKYSDV